MKVYNYTFWLMRSMRLACLSCAKGTTPVGCVANYDGVELVFSYNIGSVHAEVVTLIKASYVLNTRNLVNILLYVTLEPCFFCVMQLLVLRLRFIYFGVHTSISNNGFYLKCRFVSFKFFPTLLTYKIYKLLFLFFIYKR